ncbi:YwqI/YxiC family protein [Fictibacillus iocasae]|uniref:YwqI/YxiC family protein n=1 Tax=Fictibacillus iocasae TaxID=2715437 RepID=A0ABW2NSR6_9BACL
MQTIKLQFDEVTQQLSKTQRTLDAVSLPAPSESSLGRNQLQFTTQYLERENNLHKMVLDYIKAVTKNIEDTKANVEILKKQDQAIFRNK